MDEERNTLVLRQFSELKERYTCLSLKCGGDESSVVKGELAFSARYGNVAIEDQYEVEIMIPRDYPGCPPAAKETGGKIPKDFHLNHDGTLCLGVPLEVKRKFCKRCSLLGFVEDLLIPFLYSHSYKQK